MRCIDDHADAIGTGVLGQHRKELLQNALRNHVLLALRFFASVLHGAIEQLLLALDLFLQACTGVIVQFFLLICELLLQRFNFIASVLQLRLFRFKLLAECAEVALALIRLNDSLLDIDRGDAGPIQRKSRGR